MWVLFLAFGIIEVLLIVKRATTGKITIITIEIIRTINEIPVLILFSIFIISPTQQLYNCEKDILKF